MAASVTRKWVQRGSRPKVASAPGRASVPYSGYVVPGTGELVVTKPGRFNYETVIQSLRDFAARRPAGEGERLYVVLDNAPWHRKAARLVRDEALEEYADVREALELVSLPPYSPDLNPIEQVWRVARREVTHNRYFPDARTLEEELDGYLEGYREPNAKLASLYTFKHKN